MKFIAERKGKYVLTNSDMPLNDSSFRNQWLVVRKESGLDNKIVPYTCRHTFCTRLVEAGIPIRRLMKYSGHQTLEMIMRYTHPEEKDSDLEILDNLSENLPETQVSNA